MRRAAPGFLLLIASLAGACHHGAAKPATAARPAAPSERQLDSLWTRAEKLVQDKKWSNASIQLERFLLVLPFGDRRIPLARLKLGEAYLGDHSNLLAVREFRQVSDLYPGDSLAPIALLRAGDAYADLWHRPELDPTDAYSAQTVYQEVVTRYPSSPSAATAKKAIAVLEDKFATKGLRSAEYYIKYKAYDSALIYLRDVIATYPHAKPIPDVLSRLIATYKLLGYVEDSRDVCTYFRANWPDTPQLKLSCPATPAPSGSPTGN